MHNRARPNTMVNDAFLHQSIILSCGEDPSELLAAARTAGLDKPCALHEYRCYRFWSFPICTLVWTGIGTGCLEPLLYEILRESRANKICLVGTAGMSRVR